jgi:hypothetical protein
MKARVEQAMNKATKACKEYHKASATLRAKAEKKQNLQRQMEALQAKIDETEQAIQEQRKAVLMKLDNAQEAIAKARTTVEEESCISSEPSETKNRIFDDVIARCNADLTL